MKGKTQAQSVIQPVLAETEVTGVTAVWPVEQATVAVLNHPATTGHGSKIGDGDVQQKMLNALRLGQAGVFQVKSLLSARPDRER